MKIVFFFYWRLGVFAFDGVETMNVAEWRCARQKSCGAMVEEFAAEKISSGGFCFLNKKLWE
jgi:hypothetical protein